MHYDFETILDRSGTNALAIDGLGKIPGFSPDPPKPGWDLIPMWVADMNFAAPACITDAIIRRAQHPAFGYFLTPDAYYDAISSWHARRKGVTDIRREHIDYQNGVLGGVASALSAFSSPGDEILINSPTYVGFTKTLAAMGRHALHSPLVRDAEGAWRMDYDDMERKLRDHHVHVAILCSPHNPCGRVWERDELERAMELFERYQCVVIADEIWSDLVLPGVRYVSPQSVTPWAHNNTISLFAPSKTFNLAGLVGSYSVTYNARLRDRMRSVSDATHYNEMNVLSMEALVGAYGDEGAEWLGQLLSVIDRNVDLACGYVRDRFEGVSVYRSQGTYMLLIDCSAWLDEHGWTLPQLEKAGWDVGVAWQDGGAFLAPQSIRINLALPTSRVEEAFRRLDEHVFNA